MLHHPPPLLLLLLLSLALCGALRPPTALHLARKRGGGGFGSPPTPPPSTPSSPATPALDRFGLPAVPTISSIFPPPSLPVAPPPPHPIPATPALLQSLVADLHLPSFNTATPLPMSFLSTSPPILHIPSFLPPSAVASLSALLASPPPSAFAAPSPLFASSLSRRSSATSFVPRSSCPELVAAAADLLRPASLSRFETAQLLSYPPGGEFTYHYDAVPSPSLANGGQRVATVLVYLNSVPSGGETQFRDAGALAAPAPAPPLFSTSSSAPLSSSATTADGFYSLPYSIRRCPNPKLPPLLLLSGWTGVGDDWSGFAKLCSGRDVVTMDTDDDEYTPQATITSSSSSKPPKKRQRKATSSPALAPSELAKLLSKTVPGPTGNISKPAVDKLASALSNAAGYSKSAPPRASIVHMLSSALKRLSELSSSHFQAQLRELCSAEAQTPCFVAKSGVALVPDTVFEVLSYLPASDRVNLSAVSKDCKSFVDSPLAWDELRLQTSTKDALRHFFSRGWAVQRFCLVKRVDLGNMSMSTELWPLVFRYMPLLEQINMTNLRGAARHNAGYLLDAVTNPDRITSLILPTGLSEYAAYWGTFTKLEAVKMNWYSSCIERGGAPTLDRLFAQPTLRKFTAYMFIYNSNGDHRSYSISALSRAPNLEELSLTNVFGLSPEDWQRFAAQGKLWKLSLTASTDEKNLRVMAADKERGPLYDVDAILANRALTHLTIVRARDARWELLVGEGGLEKLLEWSEGGGNTFSAGAMDVVTRAQLVSIMAKVKKGRVWIRSEGKKELLEYKAK